MGIIQLCLQIVYISIIFASFLENTENRTQAHQMHVLTSSNYDSIPSLK